MTSRRWLATASSTPSSVGSPTFEGMPSSAFARGEVLRGPSSSLYGADAIGGVVQLFLPRGTGPLGGYAQAGIGTWRTSAVDAGVSAGTDGGDFAVGVGRSRSQGFNATLPGNFFFNPDRDGARQDVLSGSFRWAFAEGWSTDLNLTQAEGVSRFDQGAGSFDTRSVTTTRVLGWGLTRQWNADARTRHRRHQPSRPVAIDRSRSKPDRAED